MEGKKLVGQKLLRRGYTTGSCAAAAARAALCMLLSGEAPRHVSLITPGGTRLVLEVLDARFDAQSARCAIRKDAGDDPDITDGVLVYADVRKIAAGLTIEGGCGVGRVTKPGLDQPVGAAAINSTPRRMIAEAVRELCAQYGYAGGVAVTVSIPEGEALAKRSFNPRLGIEGGLSVIGTTGVVEPMSHKALADTIGLEIGQLRAQGAEGLLLTPGNYGERFLCESLGLSAAQPVQCSNCIGEALDAAVEAGFSRILLVGHIGKLVKLGIGVTNTHSAFGDGRMETLTACALEAGGDIPLLQGIMECVSTDAALELLWQAGLLRESMDILGRRVEGCLMRRVPEGTDAGYVMYTNAGAYAGVLCKSANAEQLMELWR